jgi:hypothetical protein
MTRGITAAITIAILAILMLTTIVIAHTPSVTLTCEGGLTVVLTKYSPQGRNQVRITVDGVVIVEQDFIQEYGLTDQELDPFTSHTAFVQVYAWDDPTGSKGYSKEYTLSLEPCQESPTPSPTPEVTPSPTPVPSASPDPTPAPPVTSRPTLPPTDTE